jgi:ubiquinone/menaquinone biosynthesis C-methylase UbiE
MFASILRTQEEERLDQEGLSPRGRRILQDLDRWNRAIRWYDAHVRRIRQHWEALGRPDPFRVLDVGSGSGGLLAALADSDLPCELVGVDRSPAFV